jgi:hypothetical protein
MYYSSNRGRGKGFFTSKESGVHFISTIEMKVKQCINANNHRSINGMINMSICRHHGKKTSVRGPNKQKNAYIWGSFFC